VPKSSGTQSSASWSGRADGSLREGPEHTTSCEPRSASRRCNYNRFNKVTIERVGILVRRETYLAIRAGSQPQRARARRSNRGQMAMARSAAGHESGVRMTAERVRGWTATEIAIDSLPIDSEERTRLVPRRDGDVILSMSL
jgi:hypothetical protein